MLISSQYVFPKRVMFSSSLYVVNIVASPVFVFMSKGAVSVLSKEFGFCHSLVDIRASTHAGVSESERE